MSAQAWIKTWRAKSPAPAATAATAASAALSEYGLVMPGNKRVDPVVPTTTAAENKVSAQAWIKTWREGGAATTKRPASFLDLVTSSFK